MHAATGHTTEHTAWHTAWHTTGHTTGYTTAGHTTTRHAGAGSVNIFVGGVVPAEGWCWRRAAVNGWGDGCHGHACTDVGGSSGRWWGGAGGIQWTQGADRP